MSISQWLSRWNGATNVNCIIRLIPNIGIWVNRRFGELNYYLRKMLFGHVFFTFCLHGTDIADAEHTISHCPLWQVNAKSWMCKKVPLLNIIQWSRRVTILRASSSNEESRYGHWHALRTTGTWLETTHLLLDPVVDAKHDDNLGHQGNYLEVMWKRTRCGNFSAIWNKGVFRQYAENRCPTYHARWHLSGIFIYISYYYFIISYRTPLLLI